MHSVLNYVPESAYLKRGNLGLLNHHVDFDTLNVHNRNLYLVVIHIIIEALVTRIVCQ